MFISKNLNFNMPGSGDILLDEHDFVAERFHRLSFGRLELRLELGFGHRDSHAFTTATAHGLDHDRVADGRGLRLKSFE